MFFAVLGRAISAVSRVMSALKGLAYSRLIYRAKDTNFGTYRPENKSIIPTAQYDKHSCYRIPFSYIKRVKFMVP